MKVPDLEADIEYQEDLDYMFHRTKFLADADRAMEFWRSLPVEQIHEAATRAREQHRIELIQAEARERNDRRKEAERNLIISMGIGR